MKMFGALFKRYPIISLFSLGLTGVISSYFFLSWITFPLLKYALGLTAGFTPIQMASLATQYVSAFSFWGTLALAVGGVCATTFYVTRFFQKIANVVDLSIQMSALTDDYVGAGDEARISKLIDTHLPQITSLVTTIKVNFDEIFANKEGKEALEKNFMNALSKEEVLDNYLKNVLNLIKLELIDAYFIKMVFLNKENIHPDRVKICQEILRERIGDMIADNLRPGFFAYINQYCDREGKYLFGTQKINDYIAQNASPYSVLQIDQSATTQTIDAAHRKLARLHHPDKNGGKSSPEWEEICMARQFLSNDQTRHNLDKILNDKGIVVPKIAKENVKPDLPNNQPPRPLPTQSESLAVAYWQVKANKYLANETENPGFLNAKKQHVKKKRNVLLNELGFSTEHPFYEKLESIVNEKSILMEGGHVVSSHDKLASTLQILNLHVQVLFLRDAKNKVEAKTTNLNQVVNKNLSQLDYKALMGKGKMKL